MYQPPWVPDEGQTNRKTHRIEAGTATDYSHAGPEKGTLNAMPDEPIDILHEAAVLLAECRTASLATVDAHKRPHAANIQYVHDDRLRLYFVSGEDAAHSRHVAVNPEVALTVYHPEDLEPASIRGLQLHGRVQPITDEAERSRVLTRYIDRFPFIAADAALRAAVEKQTFYRITPAWLRLIDNRRGFGWKVEIDVAANERG